MRTRSKHHGESGFAMLLVFVMAAAIAITLYMEMPRVAFESQRTKEQLAIDRGLQYERAIQLFYRKYKTYPQSLDDLETTRNVRFLRRRYLDPLTGKDWRLLHVGPSGQLTDSLVQPPAPLPGSTTGSAIGSTMGSGPNPAQGSSQTATAQPAAQPVDPNNPNDPNAQAPDPLNMARRRPSDRIIGAGGGNAGASAAVAQPPPEEEEPAPANPPEQTAQQPEPGQPPEQPEPNTPQEPAPGQTAGEAAGQPTNPAQPAPGQTPGQPGAPQNPIQFPPGVGTPGQTAGNQQNPSTTPAQNPTPFPGFQQAGQTVPGQPGAATGAPPQQSAANMIQQILTTPRQPPSSTGGFTSANTGGIAGVASTADGKGIHMVNDHAKYKEWEFVYDIKKDKTVVGAAGVNQQQQVQQQMQQNQNSNPFGNTFGSNNSPNSPSSPTTNSPTSTAPTAPTTAPPSQ